jgi:hypothetical protein
MLEMQPSGRAAFVCVGASIPFAAVAALDELAEKQGITRSAMLRAIIDRGLTESMAADPDLLARYMAAPVVPSRARRRARVYTLEQQQSKEAGCA